MAKDINGVEMSIKDALLRYGDTLSDTQKKVMSNHGENTLVLVTEAKAPLDELIKKVLNEEK